MKSVPSLVLLAILTCSAFPVAAQEPGPIARSIEREAVRLAQAPVTHRRSRASRIRRDALIGAGIGGGGAALMAAAAKGTAEETLVVGAVGAGVGALAGATVGALGGRDPITVFTGPHRADVAPGTLLLISTRGGAPEQRTFVHAGDVDIVVLNTALPALSRNTVKTLRDLAARHPDAIILAEAGGSWTLDNVRLVRDGVFVSNQKVADLTQILERIPRADVEAGRSTIVVPGSRGMGLAGRIAIGIGVGFAASLFIGGVVACAMGCGG